jgi:hypothetical protein
LIIRNCCVKNKLGMPNFRFSTWRSLWLYISTPL